jgi:hypothetical protein
MTERTGFSPRNIRRLASKRAKKSLEECFVANSKDTVECEQLEPNIDPFERDVRDSSSVESNSTDREINSGFSSNHSNLDSTANILVI